MEMRMQEVAKQKPMEVFCCYARQDQPLLLKLKKHLMPLQREGLITLWADIDINAGEEWEKEIHHHLNTARIILLLISSDFIASEYCYSVEMQRAIKRHERSETCVIPIILRIASWQNLPFGKFQALPSNANPVTSGKWHHQDDAFYDVVEGIRDIAEQAHLAEEERRRQAALAEQARLAEEERRRQAALTEQARLAEEKRRRAATAEQARLAEEERHRQATMAKQARLAEKERRRQAAKAERTRLAEEKRMYNSIGSAASDHKQSLPILDGSPFPTLSTPPPVGEIQNQQIFTSPQQWTRIAVTPVQQRPARRLLTVIIMGCSITGMVISFLFALFGILGFFVGKDIFDGLSFGDLFCSFGLMIFFIAIIGWSPSFIPKAGKTRAVIGKLIGIIAILSGVSITVIGILAHSGSSDGGGPLTGIISSITGIVIWWVARIGIKKKP